MKRLAYPWIQWLITLAVLLGSVTPMAVHAGPIVPDGRLKMVICAPSGQQLDLWVDLELPKAHQAQSGCAYCLIQDGCVPSIKLDLQFAAPESISKIYSAFHATALPIIAWMQLPSRAPPYFS